MNELTVHLFARDRSLGSSASSILQNGRNILEQAATGDNTWYYPRSTLSRTKENKTVCFRYAQNPPQIENSQQSALLNLKDWGTPVEREEVFRIHELLDFESTNFNSAGIKINARPAPTPSDLAPSTKRRRRVDCTHQYQLVPQPHFLPSPLRVSSRSVKIGPYKKSKPVMIAPYTLPLTQLTDWDRCAWLIPVRGVPPWAESTSGVLLDPSCEAPIAPNAQTNEITWTHSAVSHFWTFLLALRDAGTLGPLGLSFHPSPLPQNVDKSAQVSKTMSTVKHPESETSNTSALVRPVSVSTMDYIKIYHEWQRTLGLRKVLDAWGYETDQRKIRLLVGAKLVLLDDRSRGIMVL